MITIYVNDKPLTINDETYLQDFLNQEDYTSLLFAIAVNKKLIGRQFYSNLLLKNNDCIDVIMPMQGG